MNGECQLVMETTERKQEWKVLKKPQPVAYTADHSSASNCTRIT